MRPRVSAAADLAWYWGAGPDSYAGDCGLRSSFGAQADAAAMAVGPDGERLPLSDHSVDASAAEDQMILRLGAAHRAHQIEARLSQLSPFTVSILKAHFSGTSLPGQDPASVVAPSARRLVISLYRRRAREAISGARTAHSKGEPVSTHIRDLHRARSEARALRGRDLPPEILRAALHEATEAEREWIGQETDALVRGAIRAYEEDTRVERRSPVQLRDPRPWRS